MRVALHSLTVEGAEEAYDRAHTVIPDDLLDAFARVGISEWIIWRSGRHLFHVVEADDFDAAMRQLETDPANLAWQPAIGEFVDRFELSGKGYAGIEVPEVWALSAQRAE